MYQKKSKLQNIIVIFLDCISIICSLFVASFIKDASLVDFFGKGTIAGIAASLLLSYFVMYLIMNLNADIIKRGPLAELFITIKINVCIMIITTFILFFIRIVLDFSRAVFVYFFFIDVFLMFLLHQGFKWYMIRVYKNRKSSTQMMIACTEKKAKMVVKAIAEKTHWDYNVVAVAIMDVSAVGSAVNGIPVVTDADSLLEYCRQSTLDEIYFYVDEIADGQIQSLLQELFAMGITVHMNIDLFRMDIGAQRTLSKIGDYYAVTFTNRIMPMKQALLKRLMDIIGGLIGLLFTAVLTIFIAPAIKIESKGPIFFAQKRVGKNGRIFKMYKFRSMYIDAEERKKQLLEQNEMNGLMFKMTDDPRITKVGKFLRKTSLDEFPQFWNILKGDMSLVGTRPPTLDEFEKYKNYHKRRLSITPGLTGMWQVSGRNDISDFEEVVKLDVQYIDEWSIGLDIKILLKTVGAVFHGRGAK